MKVSTALLEKYLNRSFTKNEYNDIFIKLGYEVESVNTVNDTSGVVIAKVISAEKHPNADKLTYCKVEYKDKILDVVCGAKNVKADQYVIYAPVGSVVKGMKLAQKDLRGIISNGMILSLSEIINFDPKYLDEDSKDKIIEIPQKSAIRPIEEYFEENLMSGYVFDLTILSDREYAKNHMNIAREIAAFTDSEYSNFPLVKKTSLDSNLDLENVLLMSNVNIYASLQANLINKFIKTPKFIKNVLLFSNYKVKNDFTDILQFVFILTGVSVYISEKQNKFNQDANHITINGQNEFDLLTSELSLIPKQSNSETEITIFTTSFNVNANPFDIKNLNQIHGTNHIKISKNTDESVFALKLAARLLIKHSHIDYYSKEIIKVVKAESNRELSISLSELTELIGFSVDYEHVFGVLSKLGFVFNEIEDSKIKVIIPKYRQDVKSKQDFIEEIIRVVGTNKIVPSEKLLKSEVKRNSVWAINVDKIKLFLDRFNLNEVKTYHLLSTENSNKFNIFADKSLLRLKREYANELNVYRTNLLFSLLDAYVKNYRNNSDLETISIYEVSNIFKQLKKQDEIVLGRTENNITLGIMIDSNFDKEVNPAQILKSLFFKVSSLLNKQKLEFNYKNVSNDKIFNKYNSIEILYNDKLIGFIGELHPSILMDNKLIRLDKVQRKLFYMEIRLKDLYFE